MQNKKWRLQDETQPVKLHNAASTPFKKMSISPPALTRCRPAELKKQIEELRVLDSSLAAASERRGLRLPGSLLQMSSWLIKTFPQENVKDASFAFNLVCVCMCVCVCPRIMKRASHMENVTLRGMRSRWFQSALETHYDIVCFSL